MSKKKNNQLKTVLSIVAILMGIGAVCLMCVAAVVETGLTTVTKYKGYQAVFGLKDYMNFSVLNLIPYVLVALAVVFAVAAVASNKKAKTFRYVSAALFIVAGVLLFFTVNFVNWTEGYKAVLDVAINTLKTTKLSLGVGTIISAIVSIVAGICMAAQNLLKK